MRQCSSSCPAADKGCRAGTISRQPARSIRLESSRRSSSGALTEADLAAGGQGQGVQLDFCLLEIATRSGVRRASVVTTSGVAWGLRN